MKTFWSAERVSGAVWASLLVALAVCGYSLSIRYRAEQANKAVAFAVESDVVRQLAAAEGIEPIEAMASLKSKGINALVIGPETIGSLESDGIADFAYGHLLVQSERTNADRVKEALQSQFSQVKRGPDLPGRNASFDLAQVPASMIRQVVVGLDQDGAELAARSQTLAIVRLPNPDAARPGAIRWMIDRTAADAPTAKIFLPQGDQVLGGRGAKTDLIEGLERHHWLYATPEFGKITGDSSLIEARPDLVVRLHTAQSAEIDKLSEDAYLERFTKAAAERNQRILLLRPLQKVSDSPLSDFARLIEKLKRQVVREGYSIAAPHAFTLYEVPKWVPPLLGLALLPSVLWLVGRCLSTRTALAIGVLWALLSVASLAHGGRSLLALGCAVGLPVLAFVLFDHLRLRWLAAYAGMSLVSLLGGMCVASILNGTEFLIQADAFSAVKVAHFLPMAIVLAYLLSRRGHLRQQLEQPISWMSLGMCALGLGVLAFVISRTGNDNPAGVSGSELQFRAFLDAVMPVRPRTKEFLVGHPTLLLGLILWPKAKSANLRWPSIVLLFVGSLGQTSIVNTLCHLHSPLTTGFLRILLGLVLGGIIGVIGWGCVRRFVPEQ